METRKIQKTGFSTYIISLPKAWIIRKGIKPGDKINIIEDKDQTLRICLDNKDPIKKEVQIDVSESTNKDEIIRRFTGYYLDGATKITINFLIPLKTELIRDVTLNLKRFMGFEITEQFSNKIVLQDFFTSENLSLLKTIKREFNISKLVIEETKQILKKEAKDLSNLEIWEEEVDKVYLLIRRQINFAINSSTILRKFEITLKECQDYLLLIDKIEKITDAFFSIAENAIKIEKISNKILSKLITSFDKIIESYEIAFNSIFEKDFSKSNANYEKTKKILNYNITINETKLSEKTKENLYIIISTIHTIIKYLEEISEIGLGV